MTRPLLSVPLCLCGEIALLLLTSAPAIAQPKPAPAFLIITPKSFEPNLKPFIDYKRRHMPVRVATLETILRDSKGVDDPERLKHFLFREWKEHAVHAVLLVGDADVLPVRYMVLDRVTEPAFDYAFYPSDLYYADLTDRKGRFDDWNHQREGFHAAYFGEVRGEKNKKDPVNFDQIDYRPDIAVGRWPVSTPDEVRALVAKSIAHEESLRRAAPRNPSAAFIAVGGWVDARPQLDKMAARLAANWQTEKRYYSDAKDAPTPPPDEPNIVALLNDGIDLMLHAGHGGDDRWEGCLSVASLARVKNAGRLPILMSAGCSTARFAALPPYEAYVDVDGVPHKGTNNGEVFKSPPPPPAPYQKGVHNPTGLGEQLLRAGPSGAIAYFGCNTGGQPCGITLLEGFVDALSRSKSPTLGDCWMGAIAYYYDHEHLADLKPNDDWYPPSIFFQGMKYMLFGDPTLPVGTIP